MQRQEAACLKVGKPANEMAYKARLDNSWFEEGSGTGSGRILGYQVHRDVKQYTNHDVFSSSLSSSLLTRIYTFNLLDVSVSITSNPNTYLGK